MSALYSQLLQQFNTFILHGGNILDILLDILFRHYQDTI